MQFEKSNNKPVVVGYTVAAVAAFFTAEWLIHLPGLDILLGFPVQLVGVLILPYLGVKYLVNGDDILTDTGKVVVSTCDIIGDLDGSYMAWSARLHASHS